MKLKRIVEQAQNAAQYYDVGRDFGAFVQSINLSNENVKNQFEKAIAGKLKGKKIRARASRGYKQFEKDYDINVANVSLDDYYDNYVIVVKGTNDKEYFLKPGFKVQILGVAEVEPSEPKKSPKQKKSEEPPVSPALPAAQTQTVAPVTPQTQAPPQPVQPPQQIKENENVSIYPKNSIKKDLESWLTPLLMQSNVNLGDFIPWDGTLKREGRKAIVKYTVVIPVEEFPGLDIEQIKHELDVASKMSTNFSSIQKDYSLEKFDVTDEKYKITIKVIIT